MESRPMTRQLAQWTTEFGQAYTERNTFSAEEMDRIWERSIGVKKSDLFRQFLPAKRLPAGRVLEVGCNIGIQLGILRMVRPELKLYGIEPQPYALGRAKEIYPDMTFLSGSAFDLPFKDGYFQVVMTNGVLIHIAPEDLPRALTEIYRCSGRFIFFHEYFSSSVQQVRYHGHEELLWKLNYLEQYKHLFPDLRLVDVHYLRYSGKGGEELVDQICLLEKGAHP